MFLVARPQLAHVCVSVIEMLCVLWYRETGGSTTSITRSVSRYGRFVLAESAVISVNFQWSVHGNGHVGVGVDKRNKFE